MNNLSNKEWEYIAYLIKTYANKPEQEFKVMSVLKNNPGLKGTYQKFLSFLAGQEMVPTGQSAQGASLQEASEERA